MRSCIQLCLDLRSLMSIACVPSANAYASTTAVDMIMMTGRPVQAPSEPIIPLVIPAIPPTDRTAGTEGESEL